MKRVITLKNIKKNFGDNEVLKGIDLAVAKSEVVVIMGPSGSGKSTLLRCMTLLEEIDDGIIKIDKIEINANEYLNV